MVKINMMCGKRSWGKDWLHVDGGNFDHLWSDDITIHKLPDNSVDLLYCSHGLAYRTPELLGVWFKKLREGGCIEIATPDFHKMAWMYINGKCTLQEILGPIYGHMKMGDHWISHETVYDFNTLEAVLLQAGFVDVKLYDHRTTCHPNTGNREDKFDDCSAAYLHGELISLNVTAIKPLANGS